MEARCPRSLARGRSHCAPEQAVGGRCQAPVGGPLETRGGGRVLGSASPTTRLSQPVSLLSRLRGWLDPAADAKISFGWSREADWLGDGLVAVSGSDYHGLSSTPAGLKLIDTEAWGVRTLEPGASVHRLAEGTLFALGGTRDGKTETETGMGVSAYSTAGGKLWHALDEEPVWWLDAAGGYVYVPGPGDEPSTGRVIDLADGTLVREVKGEMAAFLVRESRS